MSATAILRFWTLVMAAYTFLDEQRDHLRQQEQHPVTLGDARCEVQSLHRRHLLHWLYEQFQVGVEPDILYEQLSA